MATDDRTSGRFFRRLLLLFPFDFRREFGSEMSEVFEEQRAQAQLRGRVATSRLWMDTIAGFIRMAPREQLTAVRQDVVYVFRTLRAAPAFTITALVVLAIGIGGNVAVFSLVQLVLLNPIPVQEPSRLVSVQVVDRQTPGYTPISTDNFLDLRRQQQSFSDVAAFSFAGVRLAADGVEPQELVTATVSAAYFDVLGVTAAAGRVIGPHDDGAPGADPVVVLSHGVWTRSFGGSNVLGQTVRLNGYPFTVIGVTPQGFRGTVATFGTDLFIPLSMYDTVAPGTAWFKGRRWRWLTTIARLRPGTTIDEAGVETRLIGDQLAAAYPDTNRGRTLAVLPFLHTVVNPNEHGTVVAAGWTLLAVAGVVLAIACVNLANLLLARSSVRAREVALRTALGASRARIVRQLLTESVLLGLGGGAAGLTLAYLTQQWLWRSRPSGFFEPAIQPAIGAEVLLFALAVSIVTGILFGLVPATQVSRTDVIATLNEAGRQPSTPLSRRLRSALLVGEVALSVVALAAAGLFIRSLQGAQQIDPGFRSAQLLQLNYNLRGGGYDEAQARLFHQRLLEALAESPGVTSAAVTTRGPLTPGGGNTLQIPGHQPPPGAMGFFVDMSYISPDYFRTLGIPLMHGRDFTADDRVGTRLVGIVNETMALRFFNGQEALGKTFSSPALPGPVEIVGVARDSKYLTLGEPTLPYFYLALLQRESGSSTPVTLHLATAGPPSNAVPAVRGAIKSLDPGVPLTNIVTGEELLEMALWAPRMAATLVSAFGLLAVLLAAIGLYGVTAYTVAQGRQEIGLRMVLGATPRGVLGMVVARGVGLASIGAVLGVAFGLAAAGWVSSLLYDVSARDPIAFLAAPIGLVIIALVACYVPAARAARLDPATTLRG